MFGRLVRESFIRNPRRKLLTAAALVVGMAVATSTLTIALEVGDRLAREFRSLGANLLVTSQSDTLPVEIGGVDYRPVNEGAYLSEADLGKLKTIFWRHNILGFTPLLDVPTLVSSSRVTSTTLIGTWYQHDVPVPDGTKFKTGVSVTHPWWKIQIRHSDEASAARTLVITGIVSTGDAEDNGILVPLSFAQGYSGHEGQFRQLFISALTKPADTFSERDPLKMTPTEYDRWFCSPYISSIGFQIKTVLPGTD